eukprot:CAMPEP_0195161148 /NCGR_PEP_ID=MMETSP0448-20130528/187021_1 /TAXON_ID=66468 /ORGANISM="Heterocapsa triquestra, Strain CCMP 448" /LENGTH=90 /DNA_ID=CAMNT_0040199949 /DNA_START=702 /DNA_END=975 /DNA_ORIENTATION=-
MSRLGCASRSDAEEQRHAYACLQEAETQEGSGHRPEAALHTLAHVAFQGETVTVVVAPPGALAEPLCEFARHAVPPGHHLFTSCLNGSVA